MLKQLEAPRVYIKKEFADNRGQMPLSLSSGNI
jgi:hypothetical protein